MAVAPHPLLEGPVAVPMTTDPTHSPAAGGAALIDPEECFGPDLFRLLAEASRKVSFHTSGNKRKRKEAHHAAP